MRSSKKRSKVISLILVAAFFIAGAFSGGTVKNVQAADGYQLLKNGEFVTLDYNKISDGDSTEKQHIKYLKIEVPEAGLVEFDCAYVSNIEDAGTEPLLYDLELRPDHLGYMGTTEFTPAGWGSFHVAKDSSENRGHADFFLAKGTYKFKLKTTGIYDKIDKKYVFPTIKFKYTLTGYESKYSIDMIGPFPAGQKGTSEDDRYIWDIGKKEDMNIFWADEAKDDTDSVDYWYSLYFRVDVPKDGKYVSLVNRIKTDINNGCSHEFSGYIDNFSLKDRTGANVKTESEEIDGKTVNYYELKKGSYLMKATPVGFVDISSGLFCYKIQELDKYLAEKKASSVSYSNEWVDGKWYDADGKQTYKGKMSWKSDAAGWWIEDSSGWYPTSQWQKIDGKWYYFTASGYMDYSEYRDGCWLGADGAWDGVSSGGHWESDSTGWWYVDNTGWYPVNQYLWIDGVQYWFNASGYWE